MEAKVVSELVNEKKNGAKDSHTRGSAKAKHECLVQLGSTLKLNTLTQRVLREFKKSNAAPVEVVINRNGGELSSLSSSSNPASNSSPPVIATEEIVEEEVIDNDGGPKKGRPLGSSKNKKKADADNLKSCMNEITYDYATKLTSLKGQKKRCPQGFLADLIAEKKTKYEVSSDIALFVI